MTRRRRMIGIRKGSEGDTKVFVGSMNAQHCKEKIVY